ncbi:MAG TPA: ferredoxin reductase [Hyphomicrobiaceae bacterium]|nr:ferredoxin reductase [Hyphomicrobiaceae bacterium]
MRETDTALADRPRLQWRTAEVVRVIDETPRVRSLVVSVPGWPAHRAGQHVDVRLTAADGYQAQRSYSIASAPEAPQLTLTVERIDDGEVSPYLATEARAGDRFEVRGPIGGYFVWTAALGGPLLLIAGGSGIAPLMAMLRHRAAAGSDVPAVLIYSSRTFADIIYREELDRMAALSDGPRVFHTLTRQQPAGWSGGARRIDREMLAEVAIAPGRHPRAFVCGPTSLVEQAARSLLALGHTANRIKTERFGPTGA